MRYYEIPVKTNANLIKEKAKINLKNFYYDSEITALNMFMQQSLINNMTFFIYREAGDVSLASFAYDDKKTDYQTVFDDLCELMKANFEVKLNSNDAYEITMLQFQENAFESRRHDFLHGTMTKVVDAAKVWTYYLRDDEAKALPFTMDERIAHDNMPALDIYDETLCNEIKTISDNRLPEPSGTNMIHYIISGNSRESEFGMAEVLVSNLLNANRLSSRRIVYISEIKPSIFHHGDEYLVNVIENNYGGTVVIDMTPRFGVSASQYVTASEYIESLYKQHGKRCQFIFTYNKNDAGFSYYLLTGLRKYMPLLTLKEGEGNKDAAVSYFKTLISASADSEYADYADEYMEQYTGDKFTQTQVLEAFDRFDSWCLNKSLSCIYNLDPEGELMLDRDKSESSYDKLQSLIGLDIVKKQIDSIITSDIVEKERMKNKGGDYQPLSSHMIFAGNPGSAKTTVAKLFAGIAREKNILKSGVFVERGGNDFNTLLPVETVEEAFTAAKGGVLFIDEAYAIASSSAITALLQQIENQRDNVIVILAGYNERMREFLERNEGLKSRVPHWVDFPDYSAEELTDIFRLMVKERGLTADEEACKAASLIFDKVRVIENFGNGRYVRNLLDRAILNQSARLMAAHGNADEITEDELYAILAEDISSLHEGLKDTSCEGDSGEESRREGAAREELDSMIGLPSAKEVINKAIAKYKLDKIRKDRGIPNAVSTMHMVFTGNPGTAKTTVARLCARILSDEKILATGNFVEVGRGDIIGDHVGSTAKLVKKAFREAQGGVLFIDEAYSLCDRHEGSFGDEAINTIVQEMENHRDDVVVIFAGYPKPMADFLERNPGMKSRIAFNVSFEDYSTDELCEITKLMLSKKHMAVTAEAMDKIRSNCDAAKVSPDYGNGRYIRKLLEEAEMNMAARISGLPEDRLTDELITTIDACDIPEFKQKKTEHKIGFAC